MHCFGITHPSGIIVKIAATCTTGMGESRDFPVRENNRPELEISVGVHPKFRSNQKLSKLWAEGLGLDQPGIRNNLFVRHLERVSLAIRDEHEQSFSTIYLSGRSLRLLP